MDKRTKRAVRILAAACALAFVLYGAARGEADIVWAKAVRVCLECIGLG